MITGWDIFAFCLAGFLIWAFVRYITTEMWDKRRK